MAFNIPRIKPLAEKDYTSETRIAFIQHQTVYNSRITNMKATLGHSATAFKAYMQWYPLFEEVKAVTGLRLATLFAWSISEAADCPLCTTYFRKMLIESGEDPEALTISHQEQALLTFGAALAQNRGLVEDAVFAPIRKHYTDAQIVLLIAFAGIMIATNIFNNVNVTEIDTYLNPFKAEHAI